jgi:hypothetical protein
MTKEEWDQFSYDQKTEFALKELQEVVFVEFEELDDIRDNGSVWGVSIRFFNEWCTAIEVYHHLVDLGILHKENKKESFNFRFTEKGVMLAKAFYL